MRKCFSFAAAVVAVVLTGREAVAQGAGACGRDSVASYGATAIDCVHCTIRPGIAAQIVEYGAEPVVRDVAPGGDALRGFLRSDVIVNVEGVPITTSAGAMLLASPVPGRNTRFDVRRDGKSVSLLITGRCVEMPDAGTPLRRDLLARVSPRGPQGTLQGRGVQGVRQGGRIQGGAIQGVLRTPADSLRRPWTIRGVLQTGAVQGIAQGGGELGFIFVGVSMAVVQDSSGNQASVYREFPTIRRVDVGGPAEKGGLQSGDVVRAVDGLLLTTIEGTRRLGSIKPKERVKFTVLRAGQTVDVMVTAGERVR